MLFLTEETIKYNLKNYSVFLRIQQSTDPSNLLRLGGLRTMKCGLEL